MVIHLGLELFSLGFEQFSLGFEQPTQTRRIDHQGVPNSTQ